MRTVTVSSQWPNTVWQALYTVESNMDNSLATELQSEKYLQQKSTYIVQSLAGRPFAGAIASMYYAIASRLSRWDK